ncbi:glycosyltransferase family 2 protein [Flavobacterium sp. ZB4P13]|uniref:glycosyltransferase family 2 protein n=1 Tax=Flavobacterium sp. ZB4P13 TaxID=3401728 RepID=UPI003AB103BE
MLVIAHSYYKVTHVTINSIENMEFLGQNIGFVIRAIAEKYPNTIVVWYDEQVKDSVNVEKISELLNLKRKLISYNPSSNYFSPRIGYIEESPFINVNKKVTYPTWQMSSCVGAIYTDIILQFDFNFFKIQNFDFTLNSIAKLYQPLGLFCYSEPQLLHGEVNYKAVEASNYVLFQFVKQHYKFVWKYLLFLDVFLFEKSVLIRPLIQSFFYKNRDFFQPIQFEDTNVEAYDLNGETIDVIIPTIGRKKYLYDVLCDLRNQTHLPKNVIVVEQNPLEESISDLDFITAEKWPFVIKHTFTHQAGACNARNIALSKVESGWVFLNDDDNRFDEKLLEKAIFCLKQYKLNTLITSYLIANEKKKFHAISQTTIFGSGNSFINARVLARVGFNMAFEFGYGEDADFGLQLRKNGFDVVYFPNIAIEHLKAPIGGFRYKHKFPWENSNIKPIPSPTIFLCRKLHHTREQLNGYKVILFIKLLVKQKWYKKIGFYKKFKSQWEASNDWANRLQNEN